MPYAAAAILHQNARNKSLVTDLSLKKCCCSGHYSPEFFSAKNHGSCKNSSASMLQFLFITSICTARWPLRHTALPDNYRQISQKQTSISTGEMKSTICVEWATDHFGLVDVNRSTFDEHMSRKRFLHFRSQWPWPLKTFRPQMSSPRYSCPALCSRFSRFKKIGSTGVDGLTDGMQHLMRPVGRAA